MEKVNVIVPIIISLALIMFSCNKEHKVTQQLAGGWSLSEWEHEGLVIPDSLTKGYSYSFETCNQKNKDCNGKMSLSDGQHSIVQPFTYLISENGNKITITTSGEDQTDVIYADILEHSAERFKIKYKDDGILNVQTLIRLN